MTLSEISARSGIPLTLLQAIVEAGRAHASRVLLYGSRARGDHRARSDIDLAFFGDPHGFPAFAEAIEALPTLLEIDCVPISDTIPDAFAANIRKDGIVLMDATFSRLTLFASAVTRLHEALDAYRLASSTVVRDGALQRFEFSTELAWKSARDYLLSQGFQDINSPKSVMKKAYLEGLITDEKGWLALLDARNQTSHLYDEAMADAVYQQIEHTYLPLMEALVTALEHACDQA